MRTPMPVSRQGDPPATRARLAAAALEVARRQWPAQGPLERQRGRDEGLEIDARGDAEAVQGVHQVFGREVPGGARRKRAPAEATGRRIERRDPVGQRRQDVGHRHAARVVDVQGEMSGGHTTAQRLEHALDLAWMRDADRVAHGHLEDAHFEQLLAERLDDHGVDVAFVRTTEAGREVAAHAHAVVERTPCDASCGRHRRVDRLVEVALREGL